MKNPILIMLLVAFSTTTILAQSWYDKGVEGKGPIVTKTLNLDDFNSFTLAISGDVYFQQGNQQSIKVEGQQNIIDLLSTEVKKDHWKIKFDQNVSRVKGLKIYITMSDLTYVGLSGSGNVVGEGTFKNLEDVGLAVSGSGDLGIALAAKSIESRISGSGNIEIGGSTQRHSIRISGSGDIEASDLSSDDCEVRISGSGDVQIDVRKQLDVRISGSGDVEYRGNPSVQSKISGSGEVQGK